jgi:hypothetical protein
MSEWLARTFYLLPSAFYLLPSAFYLLPSTFYLYLLPSVFCLLPSTFYLLSSVFCLLSSSYATLEKPTIPAPRAPASSIASAASRTESSGVGAIGQLARAMWTGVVTGESYHPRRVDHARRRAGATPENAVPTATSARIAGD